MTRISYFGVYLVLLFLIACTKETNENHKSQLKGLIYYDEEPSYADGILSFSAVIQFSAEGEPRNIEYKILDGESVVFSGNEDANINSDGGLKAFFVTPVINVPIDSNDYKNKTLTVWLDPENKQTSPEFTSEVYVNLYKKEDVVISNQ